MTLRGRGLVLEPLGAGHAAEMVDVLSDAALYRYTGGSPPSLRDLEARYARQSQGSGDPAEQWHTWVVRLGDDGPAVGYVQATVRPRRSVAELAWVLGTPWQGRGLARDAASVVLDEVAAGGVTRVVAHVHPDHMASQRVAAGLGLTPTDRVVDGEVEWERELAARTPDGIAYDRSGPPGDVPVVLVHAGVADRRMWDPQWPALTAVRDTVRLDLRGFGDSTRRPRGPLDPVADVLATLDLLGVDACHVVASSFGAGVAVEVALSRPGLVRSLVLAPPGGSLLTEATPDLRAFFAAEREALERGDLDAAVEADVATWVVGQGREATDVDPEVAASVRVMQRRAFEVTDGWDDVDEVELDPPAVERLGDLAPPVLLVVGGHDLDATHLAAVHVEAGAPRVSRVDWADTAHLPSMEQPARFLDLVLGWVAERDRP